MSEAWIIDVCRTPRGIGKADKGSLAGIHPQNLTATVMSAIAERNKIDTSDVDDVIWGVSTQQGTQGYDLARSAALVAGYNIRSGGVTLSRFCGSGLTSVNLGAASVMSGMEDLIVSGGTEVMSMLPSLERSPFLDCGNMKLRDMHPMSHQGVCADAIASMEGIDRAAVDQLAYVSQQHADHAIKNGHFEKSLVPVYKEDGTLALDKEEFPRPSTTLETLAGLKPSFAELADKPLDKKGTTFRTLVLQKYPELNIDPIHHAGNSSGVVDGSAAVLLASPQYAKANGLKPRARIVAFANVGDCPTLMLNAPVFAAQKALQKSGLTVADIDLFEVNEAFAVVTEKFIRDLNVDREKVNVNGGSIALGHPIGATGAILIGTLVDELERQDKRFGLATMCTGGGMAPAVIVERI
jgi:acetyl-CoA C-acetyltransferase